MSVILARTCEMFNLNTDDSLKIVAAPVDFDRIHGEYNLWIKRGLAASTSMCMLRNSKEGINFEEFRNMYIFEKLRSVDFYNDLKCLRDLIEKFASTRRIYITSSEENLEESVRLLVACFLETDSVLVLGGDKLWRKDLRGCRVM